MSSIRMAQPRIRRRLVAQASFFRIDALEPRRLLAADLVLSEFLASNDSGITDQFGVHSDWIEIHNRGDAAADLSEYFLTDKIDEPAQWQFPPQMLDAGGYALVFASERDLAIAGQELHTNFKLGAGGEYLGLMKLDHTSQHEYAPTFPAQSQDISYGLTSEDDPASGMQFFAMPTPGAPNAPNAQKPVFSYASRTFAGSLEVALSSPTAGAEIRYTTDRSIPTVGSPLYSGPITLTSTTQLRARAFADGHTASPVAGESYFCVDATVSGFSSNLPVIVLETFGAALNDTTLTSASGVFIDTSGGDGEADMIGDAADYAGRIGMRIRGTTSSGWPKKPYTVETWDEAGEDKAVPLLGMPAESDWILYAAYVEKSLMQNYLPYLWSTQMGRYASRVRYVEVFLNSNGGAQINYASDYQGVYILMEKIKIDDNRVDIAKLEPGDDAEPQITGGYVWKVDRVDPGESTFTTDLTGTPFVNVEPDESEITAAQKDYLKNYMDEFESVLYGPNFADPVNGYAGYIDASSWIDHWLLVETSKQIDGFRLSTYYYKDRNGKIEMGPIWDFDRSLGNTGGYPAGLVPQGWYSDTLSGIGWDIYPYFTRLFEDPNFKQQLVDRWHERRQGVFATTKLMADIDTVVGELSNHNGNYPVARDPASGDYYPPQEPNNPVVRNFQKWQLLGHAILHNGFYDPQGRWIEDVNYVKDWLTQRVEWMDSQFAGAPGINPQGGDVIAPVEVNIAVPASVARTDLLQSALSGAPAKALIPSGDIGTAWRDLGFNDATWLAGTTAVGYDRTANPVYYRALLGLDVGAMYNVNATVYMRVGFNVSEPDLLQSLTLRMKYDDAFVAYLNGTEIARSEAVPAALDWHSAATAARDDSVATSFVDFDVAPLMDLLESGDNVLAIHGLNLSANNDDLLIAPELVAEMGVRTWYTLDGSDPRLAGGGVNPNALLYAGPFTVADTTRVRARTAVGNDWSAAAEQLYSFTPFPVRITELHYHPDNHPGVADDEDLEFIELLNTGSQTVSLAGVRMTEFASPYIYTFASSLSLEPGERIVVARDPAVFQSVYGTDVNLAPTGYEFDPENPKNLSNGGERIVLLDAAGNTIQDFTYDDIAPWPTAADGDGPSLEIIDPLGDASDPANWRASFYHGGSPGTDGGPDLIAPTSSVIALPSVSSGTFAVSWSGEDAGTPATGVADYDIFVSDNGAAFVLWLDDTTTTSANFTGIDGHTYAFYSRARDHFGNVEAAPVLPDVLTIVDAAAPTVVLAQYDFEHGKLVVQFSEDVHDSLQVSDMHVQPRAGGSDILPMSVTYDAGTHTATFSFASRLPDGNYQLRIAAGAVADVVNNVLAAEFLWQDDSFFVLAGDANRDRQVTISDLGDLASNWQSTAATWSDGDFNFDGMVTISDLGDLASNWQTSVSAASAAQSQSILPLRRLRQRATDILRNTGAS